MDARKRAYGSSGLLAAIRAIRAISSRRMEFGARPMCYDTETDRRNSRVIIDACIPFRRKKGYPVIARLSKALDDRIRAKWANDLPKGL
jgi:hypothetical protein